MFSRPVSVAVRCCHPGEGTAAPGFSSGAARASLVRDSCETEVAAGGGGRAGYESKPGSLYDLRSKPESKAVHRRCFTPLGLPPPA